MKNRFTGCSLAALLAVIATFQAEGALYTSATNYPAGNAPKGVWLGGLRGNGTYRDMIVANSGDDTVTVRLCLDDGTFGQANAYPVGLQPIAVRTADFDGDGDQDIAVANFGTNTVSVLINQGFGANFKAAANYVVGSGPNPGPDAIAVPDVNGDGRSDIVVANYNENTVSVLLNLGGGVFSSPINYSVGRGPSSVGGPDVDGDGYRDIFTANKLDGTLTILPGLTNGTFDTPVTITLPDTNSAPVCARRGDFNGDGSWDIAVVNQNAGTVSILLADGGQALSNRYSVTQTYMVGTAPSGLLVRDLNRDGVPDVVVANSGDDTISILLCRGDGTFEPAVTFPVGDNPTFVVGSNFNSDRATDLAVANTGDNTVSVLLYAGPLAYNMKPNVWEDVPKIMPLRGWILSGAQLTYITNSLPLHGTLNWDSTNLIYTPEPDYFGTDSFTYSATEGSLTSAIAVVTIDVLPVNDSPSFELSTNYVIVKEDAAKTNVAGFAVNLQSGPANESAQTLRFVMTTTNNSFFAARPTISPLGMLSFRPARNVTGSITVSAQLKDSGGTARGGTNLSPVQTFTIEVRPNPVKPLRGTYGGLFFDTNGIAHHSSGYFKFVMQASGAFSGTFIAEGTSYPLTGLFDESGYAWTEVVRNNSTLNVAMQLDMTGQSDTVGGSVVEAGTNWTAQLSGNRLVFNTLNNPAPQAGKYTLVIPGDADAASKPGGDGYATVTVNSSGTVRANGRLGDDTSFSSQSGAFVSKDGQWPLYASLYSAKGSLLGWVNFTNAVEGNVQGEVSWIKTGLAGGNYYVNGFTNQMDLVGSTYTPPGVGEQVLSVTNGNVLLQGGNINGSAGYLATLTETNTIVVAGVGGQKLLKLTASSGLMSGSFIHPTLGVRRPLKSVVLQQQNVIRGYFVGTNESGSILFSSP